jgi:hypothetical protein
VLLQIDMSGSCQVRKRRLASFLAHRTSKQHPPSVSEDYL